MNLKITNIIIGIVLTASVTAAIAAISTTVQLADGKAFLPSNFAKTQLATEVRQAPIATSGDNIFVVWWTNKTGNNNDEVFFRASTDNGQTFSDKINLSNSTNAESKDAQIDSSGNRVFVTWWERNATSNEPVIRYSTDSGKTFGPILKLSNNGSIASNSS
jgi:hypothetical protein